MRVTCDGRARPKVIDPFGYRLTGRKIGANAIRMHDEVVRMVAKLFRTLRVDAIVEPTRLFTDAVEDPSNQRPDIFLRNPRGLGRQIIIDVAVTGVDGQVMRQLTDRYKLATIRSWLNMATSQIKTIYGLFPQFSLTLVKFITSLKHLLEIRFDTN